MPNKNQPSSAGKRAGCCLLLLHFRLTGLGAQLMIQDLLAHAQGLGGDLQQLVVIDELQALLQGLLTSSCVTNTHSVI